MRKTVAFAALQMSLFLALPVSAQAQTVQQVFQEFGLIGVWARVCNQPASIDSGNSHAIYSRMSADGVMLTYDNGPKYKPSVFAIVSARRAAANQLVYVEERVPDKLRVTITVQKSADEISVLSSVMDDGKVLVKDGRFTATGSVNPRQTRCGV